MINRKKVIKIFFILNKFITFIICLKITQTISLTLIPQHFDLTLFISS